MQLVHGGDWAGYRAEFGRDALDFSANVSPLGLPEGVARAITAALPTADRYPDPLCRELRAKLALHEGVPAEQILCGNGAADLIFRLVWARKPRRALVTAPTFAEYATALESVGCTVERFFLREQEDFAVTDAFCAAIRPGVDMVFLCQPNNPTGQLTALPLVVYPNSGEHYDAVSKTWHHHGEACASLADYLPQWLAAGAKLIGGCCRTTPKDIAALNAKR